MGNYYKSQIKSLAQKGDLLLNNKKDEVNKLLRSRFRPEFLNRIDEIVYFNPLTKDVQIKVVDKLLNILDKRLKENYYSVSFTDNLKKYILDSSYSYEFGARPIKRFISSNIETVIARAIISGLINTKQKFVVDYVNDKVIIRPM